MKTAENYYSIGMMVSQGEFGNFQAKDGGTNDKNNDT